MARRDCEGCGSRITGNHAVRDGMHYCPDCVHCPAAEAEKQVRSGEIEIERRYATVIDVSDLMNGADPR